MFALKSGQGKRRRGVIQPGESVSDAFIVPRPLRRPLRMLMRLDDFESRLPRFVMTMLSAGMISAGAIYGALVGGHMPEVMQAITSRTGFAVTDIRVNGNQQTSEIDVLGQLQLDGWTSLIGFNADGARERLASLPWIDAAAVRKVYPDTIEVSLTERVPFAIWQHGQELTVIESDGRPIAPYSRRHADLPLVIGMGASEKAAAFVAKMAAYPQLASQVKAYVRIADRRWDLHLANGVKVKLPEHKTDAAIQELLALDGQKALLSRDILGVDLRFDDRLIVRLTPEAVERRAKELEAAKKAAKKAGRQI